MTLSSLIYTNRGNINYDIICRDNVKYSLQALEQEPIIDAKNHILNKTQKFWVNINLLFFLSLEISFKDNIIMLTKIKMNNTLTLLSDLLYANRDNYDVRILASPTSMKYLTNTVISIAYINL